MSSWCNITVGNLGEIITGYTPPTKNAEYFGDKYPFITPTDIKTDSRVVQTERFLSLKGYEYNKSRLLPPNAVCVTCIASIGKICTTTVPSVTNQQINSIVVNQDKYDPSFVYYLLKTKTDVIQSVANSATTPIVNKSTFASINVCVPPLSIQRAIANFLDRKTEQIDELIRIKERQIELLQEQRTALINQAVTKGLDPNVEMKPSGVKWIGEIPRHWKIKRLKYIADLNMGQSPPSEEYNTDQVGTPFLQGNAEFGSHHPTPKIYCPTAKKYASPSDILVSVRAPVGAINVADKQYGIGRGLCAIRPRTNQLECHYAKYLLEVVRTELHVVATGSTYEAVTVDEVSNLTCVVPSLSKQIQIANFLKHKTKQIDELIAAEQRKIELLKEYRQSLISEAVTGKIDVQNEV